MTKSFDVFLSHNSKDKPAVRELAEALRARGLKVWLDEWELVPGRPWQEALEEVIETTGSSAVLVGKDGLGPWQDAEMRGCLSEFVDRKLPVIPVLLPSAPEQPKLPFFLKRFTWVDLRGGMTEEGLDRLQWGITGSRTERSKPLSTPAATQERHLETQATPPASSEGHRAAEVPLEESYRKSLPEGGEISKVAVLSPGGAGSLQLIGPVVRKNRITALVNHAWSARKIQVYLCAGILTLLLGSFLYWRLKPSPRALEPWPDVIYSARKKLSLRKDPLIQAMSDIKLSHFYGKDDIIISAAIDLSNFQKQAGALV